METSSSLLASTQVCNYHSAKHDVHQIPVGTIKDNHQNCLECGLIWKLGDIIGFSEEDWKHVTGLWWDGKAVCFQRKLSGSEGREEELKYELYVQGGNHHPWVGSPLGLTGAAKEPCRMQFIYKLSVRRMFLGLTITHRYFEYSPKPDCSCTSTTWQNRFKRVTPTSQAMAERLRKLTRLRRDCRRLLP
jgi:hypothetical protein